MEPLKNAYQLSELSIKATPLILIALGLAVCYRANVWNIGAEGQFVLGALFAGLVPDSSAKAISRYQEMVDEAVRKVRHVPEKQGNEEREAKEGSNLPADASRSEHSPPFSFPHSSFPSLPRSASPPPSSIHVNNHLHVL